jgi:hypothetical protein
VSELWRLFEQRRPSSHRQSCVATTTFTRALRGGTRPDSRDARRLDLLRQRHVVAVTDKGRLPSPSIRCPCSSGSDDSTKPTQSNEDTTNRRRCRLVRSRHPGRRARDTQRPPPHKDRLPSPSMRRPGSSGSYGSTTRTQNNEDTTSRRGCRLVRQAQPGRRARGTQTMPPPGGCSRTGWWGSYRTRQVPRIPGSRYCLFAFGPHQRRICESTFYAMISRQID